MQNRLLLLAAFGLVGCAEDAPRVDDDGQAGACRVAEFVWRVDEVVASRRVYEFPGEGYVEHDFTDFDANGQVSGGGQVRIEDEWTIHTGDLDGDGTSDAFSRRRTEYNEAGQVILAIWRDETVGVESQRSTRYTYLSDDMTTIEGRVPARTEIDLGEDGQVNRVTTTTFDEGRVATREVDEGAEHWIEGEALSPDGVTDVVFSFEHNGPVVTISGDAGQTECNGDMCSRGQPDGTPDTIEERVFEVGGNELDLASAHRDRSIKIRQDLDADGAWDTTDTRQYNARGDVEYTTHSVAGSDSVMSMQVTYECE